ncbi:MAG: hypothetical protein ACQEQE_04990 [Bacillota bacterium]
MKKKSILFIFILVLLNFPIFFSEKRLLVKSLRFLNRGLLAYYFTLVFMKNGFDNINKKSKMTKKEFIASILWALTFLLSNYIEYNSLFKIINIFPLFMIFIVTLEYNQKIDFEKNDIFYLGNIYLGYILFLPIILILIFKGF